MHAASLDMHALWVFHGRMGSWVFALHVSEAVEAGRDAAWWLTQWSLGALRSHWRKQHQSSLTCTGFQCSILTGLKGCQRLF